jgi:tRNA threonylcarbamoyladenosine biosynthesis protein TsaE
MTLSLRLASTDATGALGQALARHCPWDDRQPLLLFLSGELGAGKTLLAAALLKALGVEEQVRSPSYALIETYRASAGEAVHIDLYRLQGADELQQLGLTDYLNPNTLLLVEWPERAGPALPPCDLQLRLTPVPQDPAAREVRIDAPSAIGRRWLQAALGRSAEPDVS